MLKVILRVPLGVYSIKSAYKLFALRPGTRSQHRICLCPIILPPKPSNPRETVNLHPPTKQNKATSRRTRPDGPPVSIVSAFQSDDDLYKYFSVHERVNF